MGTDFFLCTDLKGNLMKEDVLNQLSLFLSDKMKADSKIVLKSMKTREEIVSTALEKGIAVPHAFIPGLSEAHVCVLKCEKEISDWICLDDSLVQVVICMVLPEVYDEHTKGIANLTKLFQQLADSSFLEKIGILKTSRDIVEVLSQI